MNPVAKESHVTKGDETYRAIWVVCPGCKTEGNSGLHMLPIEPTTKRPFWTWDGNEQAPTLSPSILTKSSYYTGKDTPPRKFICHSYLRNGVWEYLDDSTHSLKGQHVPTPPLEDWML